MIDKINIRRGAAEDWAGLAGVFHQAVNEGAGLYTAAQRQAWSPASRAGPDWSLRMSRQSVMLAETGSTPVGFISAELNGYFDCTYILKTHQGRGLFRALYEPLEAELRANAVTRLHVHASLHARPAFAAMGYQIVRPETVQMPSAADGGVWLPRFLMEKHF